VFQLPWSCSTINLFLCRRGTICFGFAEWRGMCLDSDGNLDLHSYQ
jgi:hypothetical protein